MNGCLAWQIDLLQIFLVTASISPDSDPSNIDITESQINILKCYYISFIIIFNEISLITNKQKNRVENS